MMRFKVKEKCLVILIVLTSFWVKGESKQKLYGMDYNVSGCNAEYYLNDMPIFLFKIKKGCSYGTGFNLALIELLKKKNNVLIIKSTHHLDEWNKCIGAVKANIYKNENSKLKQFINLEGNYSMTKEKSKKEKISFLFKSSHSVTQEKIGDENIITLIFDADFALQDNLPWESEKKVSLRKQDNDDIKKIIMDYYMAIINKNKEEMMKPFSYRVNYFNKVFNDDSFSKARIGYVTGILDRMIGNPISFKTSDIKLIRYSNNLFRAILKNKDYLLNIPVKRMGKHSLKAILNKENVDKDYEEPEEDETDLFNAHSSFDMFFSKKNDKWEIIK